MKNISPSAIYLYTKCPRRYLYYSMRLNPLQAINQESIDFGTYIHRVIEEYYTNIDDSITPHEVGYRISRAVSNVLGRTNDEKIIQHIDGFILFEKRRLEQGSKVKPYAIEKFYAKPPLHGKVDAVLDYGGTKTVVDWKTQYSYPQLTESMYIQGIVYRKITGIDEVWFVFLNHKGRVVQLPHNNLEKYETIIKNIVSAITDGNYEPRRGHWCDDCPYQLYCYADDYSIDLAEMVL